jgi:hypothetical protein
MTAINQKYQILESLDSLDESQKNKVMEYINGLLYTTDEARHKNLKRTALKEIRQALNKKRSLNLAF